MTKRRPIGFRKALYDDQLGRTLASAYAGMADLGEAFAVAAVIGPHATPDTWFEGWNDMAVAVDRAAAAGHAVSARNGLLRASEYYRQTFFFIRHLLDDDRLRRAHADHVRTFAAAGPDFGIAHGVAVEIPYEDTALHGWVFSPDGSGVPRPTVLLPDGHDSQITVPTLRERPARRIGRREGPGQPDDRPDLAHRSHCGVRRERTLWRPGPSRLGRRPSTIGSTRPSAGPSRPDAASDEVGPSDSAWLPRP